MSRIGILRKKSANLRVVQVKSAKEEERKKMMKNQPGSSQLYDEKEAENRILEKNQQKTELFEIEVEESDDEEEQKVAILAKIKSLGISKTDVKIRSTLEEVGDKMDDTKLEELDQGDISKYIGSSEDENNDKLFG